MIIDQFDAFVGQHCETTATGSLLKRLGIELSEPMLFGVGEGLGFIFWNMKIMDFPSIGGRIKPDMLTQNITRNLNLQLEEKETSSVKKAWQNVVSNIDKETPVGLKLDCYHLEYFTSKTHFAGHYVAMYGYDNKYAYLIDTQQQGGKVKTSLKSFGCKSFWLTRIRQYFQILYLCLDFGITHLFSHLYNNSKTLSILH